MATSGEILSNNVVVSSPYTCRMRIEWQLASQNVAGNYSTINWQAYVDFFGCDAQLDNGHVNTNVGAVYNNGGRVYNYAGNFSNHTVTIGSGSFNIGADGAGNTTLQMNGTIAVFDSGTATCGTTSWGLPTINRYSNVTSFNYSNVTDESFTLSATCDLSASVINFSIDGGATYGGGGSGTSASQTYHNLQSNKTYTCYVQTVNASSGLQQFGGPQTPTTAAQNNFVGKRVI